MITDVLHNVNIHTFLCKVLWAKSCYGHCAIEVLHIIIIITLKKLKEPVTVNMFCPKTKAGLFPEDETKIKVWFKNKMFCWVYSVPVI